MDYDELAKWDLICCIYKRKKNTVCFTWLIRSRAWLDVLDGNDKSFVRISRIVSCWVRLSNGGLPTIFE